MRFRIVSLNMHKGFSQLNSRFVLHELREAVRSVKADLVFLQEVQGEHSAKARKYEDWPDQTQYEFLADDIWSHYAYGKNAIYPDGHHGNSILSRFPIRHSEKVNISTNRVEQRGLLCCELDMPDGEPMFALCVHLSLFALSRRKQLTMIQDYIKSTIPDHAPLVLAGDFNDWTGLPTQGFSRELGLGEAFVTTQGRNPRTFPSNWPLLRLDRIFYRALTAEASAIHSRGIWGKLSDHAALVADMSLKSRNVAHRAAGA
ncbi:MAG: hypothetical protein AMXMBFR84_33940 [Candidatus Hydrogenedentota bacterium]